LPPPAFPWTAAGMKKEGYGYGLGIR
jgi:hypothetical protein